MPLPETILDQFRSVNRSTTDESEYYGPYTSLLTDLFPHDENFQVVPQLKGPTFLDTLDSTIIFVVMKQKVPVFFIEIKPYDDLQSNIRRGDADEQMRRRFGTCLEVCPFLSSMGLVPWARAFPSTNTQRQLAFSYHCYRT